MPLSRLGRRLHGMLVNSQVFFPVIVEMVVCERDARRRRRRAQDHGRPVSRRPRSRTFRLLLTERDNFEHPKLYVNRFPVVLISHHYLSAWFQLSVTFQLNLNCLCPVNPVFNVSSIWWKVAFELKDLLALLAALSVSLEIFIYLGSYAFLTLV